MLERVGEHKDIKRVFRLEEGYHPSYLKSGRNQGLTYIMNKTAHYPIRIGLKK